MDSVHVETRKETPQSSAAETFITASSEWTDVCLTNTSGVGGGNSELTDLFTNSKPMKFVDPVVPIHFKILKKKTKQADANKRHWWTITTGVPTGLLVFALITTFILKFIKHTPDALAGTESGNGSMCDNPENDTIRCIN